MKHFLIISSLLLLTACTSDKPAKPVVVDPAFGAYISGYTAGLISAYQPITIQLAQPFSGVLPEDIISLQPHTVGHTHLANEYTLVFTPDEPLAGNTHYTASLLLGKIMDVPDGHRTFQFSFQTIGQQLSVYTDGPQAYDYNDLTRVKITGIITCADRVESSLIKSVFEAAQGKRKLNMTFSEQTPQQLTFEVENAVRSESADSVVISWDGAGIGTSDKGRMVVAIPALGDFSVTSTKSKSQPQQSIEIYFSDPIAEQKLGSIINIEGVNGLTFTISGHVVEVFPDGQVNGSRLLTVLESIKNTAGKMMPQHFSTVLSFEQDKPAVRMVGDKSIMPVSQGLIIPFEAVSLRAVDVYITKVFTNNILQYLQEYDLNSNNTYLNQIGRHIYKRHIDLRAASRGNIQSWQRYYVNLAEIIAPDPGAFYKVQIRFRPEYACYPCGDEQSIAGACLTGNVASTETQFQQGTADGNLDPYYFVDDYYDFSEWDWDNRDNPCHAAYYGGYRQRVERTFMATDMGLMAKMGGDGQMLLVVTDLSTALPVVGAQVEVFDFQQQSMGTAKSNNEGFAALKIPGKPFVAVATVGNRKTWLKVDPASSLSLSKFEVAGANVQDGVKGYIYGERGVWRPGDSLYLNFVMEDRDKLLPENHPVNFELRNPNGQVVQKFTRSESVNGFYDFRSSTDADAPTGDYTATFHVGNRSYSKSLKIETVKPNRLKIDFEFGSKVITSADELNTSLEARWLHGAIASGLTAKVEMRMTSTKTKFDKWTGYHFDNSLEYTGAGSEEVVYEGGLDANGKAAIKVNLKNKAEKAPGMMKLSFFTKVFEPGGNFSVDYTSVNYAPYKSFTGIRIPEGKMWGGALETDQAHQIDLVTVDPLGKQINRSELEVSVYRINNRWWYDRYDGENFNFLNSSSYYKVKTEKAKMNEGKGSYSLRIEKNDWGSYLIVARDLVSGHSSAQFVYFDWPYWMRANRVESEASTILGFSSDKQKYNVGETIKLTFPSPSNGRALVCIENGTRIIEKRWVETKAGETHVELAVTAEMTPNVFAHIALIQPHAQTENDRPIRMFGVIPLSIEDLNTKLEPVIASPSVLRPETIAEIKVSEANGKAMTYTLAVVDEGLLDLTRFKTPNPWDQFYAPEALGVKTWDMFDLVIGAFGQNIGTLLSIGGDDEALDPSKQKAMRFIPMVRYMGPFTLSKGKGATHKIQVPNYVGSVRVMVVAGQNEAWGSAEKSIPVRSPLMVLGTLPRVLGPGEKVSLPVNVFAMEDHVKNVQIKVTTTSLFKNSGTTSRSVSFERTGESMVQFELETAEKIGVAKLTIEATSGAEKSVHEIEIDVRSPNPPYTTSEEKMLQPGEKWQKNFERFGMEGTNKAVLEISNMPSLNLESRLSYLIQYPHGCVEQITSAAFPQLYLSQLTQLNAEKQAQVDHHIKETLKRLRAYQISSGGLAYWPGRNYYSDWGTTYSGHFILEAEAKGYALPAGLKQSWLRFQADAARRWNTSTERDQSWSQRAQAYRLFTLARAAKPDLGAMNLLRDRSDMDGSAKWILALAYAEAGQSEAAKKLIATAPKTISPYTELEHTYGSDLRDEAFVLLAMQKLGMNSDAAFIAKKIAGSIGSSEPYSTQTTAMSLCALSTFFGGKPTSTGLKAKLNEGANTIDIATGKPISSHTLKASNANGTFTLQNNGSQALFAKLMITGQPIAGKEERKSQHIKMEVKYTDANFKEIDPARLKAGTDFIAEVKVYNIGSRGNLSEMALVQVFPSGWEILNHRLEENAEETSTPTYQDVRDDRVMSYFGLARNKAVVYKVRLNANYAGRYYLPATLCYAMYDESIMATEPGRWVEVIK